MDEELITQVRDILISTYLVMGILVMVALMVLACMLVKATRRLLNAVTSTVETANGTLENVNRASGAALNYITSPAGEGSTASFANGLGMIISFVSGLRGKSR